MDKINDAIETDFERTVATWNNRPRFTKNVYVAQHEISGYVRTVRIWGSKPPELIYYFIVKGTKVRFARMTQDFEPKSRPYIINSFAGRGGLDTVDVKHPYPGIKGRAFDEVIAAKHQTRVAYRIEAAIARGAKASGHLYR